MLVKHLQLDGNGSLSVLAVKELDEGLNVLHGDGRDAIGLLRYVLFGGDDACSPGSSVNAACRLGATVTLSTPDGCLAISRSEGVGEGMLTAATEDGRPLDANPLEHLLAGVSPALFDHVFAVDFDDRPQLSQLLHEARDAGIDLAGSAQSPRLAQLWEALEAQRDELAAIPHVSQSLRGLQVRRQQLREDIGSIRRQSAQGVQPEQIPPRERRRSTLRDEIAAQHQQLQQLDAAVQDVERKIYDLRAGTARAVVMPGRMVQQRRKLGLLDEQLDRWQSVLREIGTRRLALQQATSRLPVSPDDGGRVRKHLRALERQISGLQAAVDEVDQDRWSSRHLRSALTTQLREMQDNVYRVCRELSRSQSGARAMVSALELEQLSRCELDLQAAIRGLTARRQQLQARLASSAAAETLVADQQHARRCQCQAHPQAQPLSATAQEAAQRQLAQLAGELRRLESARTRIVQTLDELQCALVEAEEQDESSSDAADRETAAEVERLRDELDRVEQELQRAERRQAALVALGELQQILEQRAAEGQSAVLDQAAAYLRRLSCGEFRQLEVHGAEVIVHDRHACQVNWSRLDEGARDQVYLSLCLAVVDELHRRGTRLPLALNGAFARISSRHVRESAEVIREFALRGHQVLLFTPHEHVAKVFRLLKLSLRTLHAGESLAEPNDDLHCEPYNHPAADTAAANRPAPCSLSEECPIEDAPSLDEANAVRFRKIGVWTVGDLLDVDPRQAAARLQYAGVSRQQVLDWQAQARLVCQVPRLRPYDARILVACGVTEPEQLRCMRAGQLREMVREFAATSRGRALLMSGSDFELSRISEWINQRTRREHRSGPPPGAAPPTAGASDGSRKVIKLQRPVSTQFYLDAEDSVVDAPSIGPKTAERLGRVGVRTVAELLQADAGDLAKQLQHKRTNADTIRQWQQQAALACRVPELRGHDAQLLVALGVTDPRQLAAFTPQELWEKVKPLAASNRGRRIIRNGKAPDLDEVADWIRHASAARTLKAA